jgi:hypothetical protein
MHALFGSLSNPSDRLEVSKRYEVKLTGSNTTGRILNSGSRTKVFTTDTRGSIEGMDLGLPPRRSQLPVFDLLVLRYNTRKAHHMKVASMSHSYFVERAATESNELNFHIACFCEGDERDEFLGGSIDRIDNHHVVIPTNAINE